jgi:hypothetical protein
MKLLHVSLLIAGAGASWFGLHSKGASASMPKCSAGACSVEVECIDPQTCQVTCYDEHGAVLCKEELPCDEPCSAACSTSCEPESSEAPAPVLVSAPAPDDDC